MLVLKAAMTSIALVTDSIYIFRVILLQLRLYLWFLFAIVGWETTAMIVPSASCYILSEKKIRKIFVLCEMIQGQIESTCVARAKKKYWNKSIAKNKIIITDSSNTARPKDATWDKGMVRGEDEIMRCHSFCLYFYVAMTCDALNAMPSARANL